jgi:Intraflagellar transport complex B protein 46 C terminal
MQVVDFALRSFFVGQRLNGSKPQTKVRSIELHGVNRDAGTKAIHSWLNHVKESYSSRASDYTTKDMESEIERLMAQWPTEIDQALTDNEVPLVLIQVLLPSPDMDLTLKEYMQLCCNIVDIPVNDTPKKKNARIQAAEQLIMLYSGFKMSQHFG